MSKPSTGQGQAQGAAQGSADTRPVRPQEAAPRLAASCPPRLGSCSYLRGNRQAPADVLALCFLFPTGPDLVAGAPGAPPRPQFPHLCSRHIWEAQPTVRFTPERGTLERATCWGSTHPVLSPAGHQDCSIEAPCLRCRGGNVSALTSPKA